jgi:hypothetical protein
LSGAFRSPSSSIQKMTQSTVTSWRRYYEEADCIVGQKPSWSFLTGLTPSRCFGTINEYRGWYSESRRTVPREQCLLQLSPPFRLIAVFVQNIIGCCVGGHADCLIATVPVPVLVPRTSIGASGCVSQPLLVRYTLIDGQTQLIIRKSQLASINSRMNQEHLF